MGALNRESFPPVDVMMMVRDYCLLMFDGKVVPHVSFPPSYDVTRMIFVVPSPIHVCCSMTFSWVPTQMPTMTPNQTPHPSSVLMIWP